MTRKIHFILFNLVVVDLAFIGTRTLIHTNILKPVAYHLILTFLMFMLAVFDCCEIFYISFALVFETVKKM